MVFNNKILKNLDLLWRFKFDIKSISFIIYNMSIQQFSVILTIVILNSFAQIFLKISAINTMIDVDRPVWTDIWLFLGLGTYATSMILWIKILKYVPLNLAAPFSGLAFIFVPLLCAIFLNERITPQYFIGSILIVLGILIISKS